MQNKLTEESDYFIASVRKFSERRESVSLKSVEPAQQMMGFHFHTKSVLNLFQIQPISKDKAFLFEEGKSFNTSNLV